jgi:hypothetical protein
MVICAALLLSFLFWKEIARENKLRFVWRLLASALCVVSLLCMALPFANKITVNADERSMEAVLLTEGFHQDSLTNFLKEKKLPVYTTNAGLYQSAHIITSLDFFSAQHKNVIHIFGNGLNKDELKLLDQTPVLFHPSKPEPAIITVNWSQKIKVGEKLFIQGRFNNTSSKKVTLFLKGLNTIADSASIPANQIQDFELAAIPKHIGRAVYSLIAVSGNDTLKNEPIPFETISPATLKILILASSPGFENKFLKNWLSQHGYELTIRTTVSKNKVDRQFLNTPRTPGNPVNAAYLDKFDMVIADLNELTSTSKPELEAIRSQVEQKGLGLIVKSDSSENKPAFYSKPFPLFRTKNNTQQSFTIRDTDSATGRFKLNIENPVCIRYQPGTQVLLQDDKSNIYVSSSMYGSGKIISTSFDNTYSLVLSGNSNEYESLWSLILQKASRKITSPEDWWVSPAFVYANQPVQLNLETTHAGIAQGQAGESAVYLRQNPLLPFQWQGNYWPTVEGWHPSIQSQGATYWWYVYKPGEWKNLFSFQTTNDTKKYMSEHPYNAAALQASPPGNSIQSLKICLFLVFIFCCGFLWIERKI